MPHIKFQSSPLRSGNNHGSCGALLAYLEKEDKNREEGHALKGFFNAFSNDLSAENAKEIVEHVFYKKGLKHDADKFFTVTMSFSKDELEDRTDRELMEFAKDRFAEMYVGAVKGREIDPEKIAWVAKLEETRSYKGTDQEVKEGLVKSGAEKEGDQRHIHFVVARKTLDDKQISPMSNHFRGGADTGAVKSGYDQDHFKFACETAFDRTFSHERKEGESVKEHLAAFRPDLVEKFRDQEQERETDQVKQKLNQPLDLEKEIERFKEVEKRWIDYQAVIERTRAMIERMKERVIEPIKDIASRIMGGSSLIKKTSEGIEKEDSILKKLDEIKKQEQEKKQDKGNDLGRSL